MSDFVVTTYPGRKSEGLRVSLVQADSVQEAIVHHFGCRYDYKPVYGTKAAHTGVYRVIDEDAKDEIIGVITQVPRP